MKIVRVLFAVSLALLAAAPAYAVPVPPPPKPSAAGAPAQGDAPPAARAPAPEDTPPVVASDESKPVDAPAPAESTETPNRSGADVQAWFDSVSLPAWITDSGLPPWAWVLLGLVAFLVLRGLLRRGERSDLIGPPPNMRLGARANPPAPRRADPPQRG